MGETGNEIKAAARDVLRVGTRWANAARDWFDERRNEMNNRYRDDRDEDERDRMQRSRQSVSGYGTREESERYEGGGRFVSRADRGDRDIQGDYAAGGEGSRRYGPSGQDYGGGHRAYGQSGYEGARQSRASGYESGDYGQGRREFGASGFEGSRFEAGRSRADEGGRSDYGRGEAFQRGTARQWDEMGAQGYAGRSQAYASDEDFGGRGPGFQQGARTQAQRYGTGQGMQGARGAQAFGDNSDYASGSTGYGREAYGGGQFGEPGRGTRGLSGQGYGDFGRDIASSQRWGQGGEFGQAGARFGATGYRGLGPSNYTRSDERIREDLNERLTEADDLDASGLSVEVSNGIATLTGTVEQRWMKHRAEDIVEACTGVRDVNNQIQVGSQWQGKAPAYGAGTIRSGTGTTTGSAGTMGSTSPRTTGGSGSSGTGLGGGS